MSQFQIKKYQSICNMDEALQRKLLINDFYNCLDIGIFPMSVKGGEQPYEKRSDYQNGWNDAQMKIMEQVWSMIDKFDKDGYSDDLALLIAANIVTRYDDKFLLTLNDIFYYASDSEEINKEDVKEITKLYRSYGRAGVIYWVSKKRNNEIPQIPMFVTMLDFVNHMEAEYAKNN